MSLADITIIAANYNNAKFLESFLASIYSGSLLPQKIIITDDASTDNSNLILKGLLKQYPQLEVIYFAENEGVANARNAAISKVKTKYIAIADVDDLFEEDRIKQQVEYLNSNPEIDLLGSDCFYFQEEDGASQSKSNFPNQHKEILAYFKSARNGLLNGTVAAKSELFRKFQYDQATVWAEDYDLFSRMILAEHQTASLPEALMRVRIHQNSQTTNLQFETIKKIYQLREKYFAIKYNETECLREYQHLINYRKYLASKGSCRYCYLLKAIFYSPEKLLKRLKSYVTS